MVVALTLIGKGKNFSFVERKGVYQILHGSFERYMEAKQTSF